jgi:hypothetical protein
MLDLTPMTPARRGPRYVPLAFPREAACRIVGLTPATLEAWAGQAQKAGVAPPITFGVGGLVALMVLRDLADRLGPETETFTSGLAQLFQLLAPRTDARWLASQTALIGRDFARLCELRTAHIRCDGGQFLAQPLRPLVAELQDRVFS